MQLKKEKNFIMSMTNINSNKERELQDVGDQEIHCEPLLDYIDVDLETDTGSRDMLQGVKQEGYLYKLDFGLDCGLCYLGNETRRPHKAILGIRI